MSELCMACFVRRNALGMLRASRRPARPDALGRNACQLKCDQSSPPGGSEIVSWWCGLSCLPWWVAANSTHRRIRSSSVPVPLAKKTQIYHGASDQMSELCMACFVRRNALGTLGASRSPARPDALGCNARQVKYDQSSPPGGSEQIAAVWP